MPTYHVYALQCPIDLKYKYVGVTRNPKTRLNAHLAGSLKGISNWVFKLRETKQKPKMVILESGSDFDPLIRERFWIGELNPCYNAALWPSKKYQAIKDSNNTHEHNRLQNSAN